MAASATNVSQAKYLMGRYIIYLMGRYIIYLMGCYIIYLMGRYIIYCSLLFSINVSITGTVCKQCIGVAFSSSLSKIITSLNVYGL